jgi:hypothetical protein
LEMVRVKGKSRFLRDMELIEKIAESVKSIEEELRDKEISEEDKKRLVEVLTDMRKEIRARIRRLRLEKSRAPDVRGLMREQIFGILNGVDTLEGKVKVLEKMAFGRKRKGVKNGEAAAYYRLMVKAYHAELKLLMKCIVSYADMGFLAGDVELRNMIRKRLGLKREWMKGFAEERRAGDKRKKKSAR